MEKCIKTKIQPSISILVHQTYKIYIISWLFNRNAQLHNISKRNPSTSNFHNLKAHRYCINKIFKLDTNHKIMLIDFEENEQNVFLFLFFSINGYFNLFLAKQFIKEIFVSFPNSKHDPNKNSPLLFPTRRITCKGMLQQRCIQLRWWRREVGEQHDASETSGSALAYYPCHC